VCPIWLPVFFFYNEPELGEGIDPGMVLTTFPSSMLNETRFKFQKQKIQKPFDFEPISPFPWRKA